MPDWKITWLHNPEIPGYYICRWVEHRKIRGLYEVAVLQNAGGKVIMIRQIIGRGYDKWETFTGGWTLEYCRLPEDLQRIDNLRSKSFCPKITCGNCGDVMETTFEFDKNDNEVWKAECGCGASCTYAGSVKDAKETD